MIATVLLRFKGAALSLFVRKRMPVCTGSKTGLYRYSFIIAVNSDRLSLAHTDVIMISRPNVLVN